MQVIWPTHELNMTGFEPSPDAVETEWLLTNGTGAYAMGTVAGVNTRRYHGLLVAATRPPVGRVVAVNQIIERLTVGQGDASQTVDLSGCLFHPGHDGKPVGPNWLKLLRGFEKGLGAQWVYEPYPGVQIRRQLLLHWKQQAITVRYAWGAADAGSDRGVGGVKGENRGRSGEAAQADQQVVLTLSPLISLRDFHSLLRVQEAGPVSVEPKGGGVVTVYRGGLAVTLSGSQGAFVPVQPTTDPWWYNISYPRETQRGQDDREDLFIPGHYRVELRLDQPAEFSITVALGEQAVAAIESDDPARVTHLEPIVRAIADITATSELGTRLSLNPTPSPEIINRALAIAADDFVVGRRFKDQDLSTIIAGYPWFADWGRDTFISLEGLLLVTRRFAEAKSVLRVYAESLQNGLVPNRFDDYNSTAAHYNAVDASLWFVHAAIAYARVSGDQESWDQWLCQAARQVIDAYIRSTDYDIRMAGDALITAGSAQTQLTWMDAACGGVVFTPRHGKAVEVNALWYCNLVSMADLLDRTDPTTSEHYRKLTKRIARSFAKVFWDPARNYLNDHVWIDDQGQERADTTIRPNQIFAASLPHSPLPLTRQKKVLAVVREELLTPFGLRTLAQDDPNYRGRYTGSMFERDSAYHRGTVWPWLIGPYAEAVLRTGQFSKKAKAEALAVITPLLDRLMTEGLGQLREIHEGDPPHRAEGCVAQAWSVAELLRVLSLMNETR